MFKLGEKYTVTELDEKEMAIRTQLVTKGMDESIKGNLTRFLSEAKSILLKEISGNGMMPTPPLYVPAKLEEFVAGSVNPYERRTLVKSVCIDSVFRFNVKLTEQRATDFTYILPETVKSVVSMRLAAIEVPAVYTFSSKSQSDTFKIHILNGPSGNETFTVTIPEGSYDLSEMTDVLTTAINAQMYYVIGVVTNHSTVIRFKTIAEGDSVYDPTGGYYAPTAELKLDFVVEGKLFYTTAGWTLGYRNTIIPGPATSHVPYTKPNYVFLEVDDFQNNFQTDTVISTNGMSYMGNNLLGRVLLNNFNDHLVFKKREYFGPVRIDKLHFRLLTRFGEVVDLGGADFSFVLEFTTVYS